MMAAVLGVAIIIGWVLGGSLWNLIDLQFRGFAALCLAFIMQAFLWQAPERGWTILVQWGFLLLLISYGILLAILWMNRSLTGISLIAAGVLMNVTVIAFNEGMPVCRDALAACGGSHLIPVLESGDSVIHTLMTDDTALRFLGDHIASPGWFPWATVVSPGDVVMMMGIVMLVPTVMMPGSNHNRG